MKSTVQGDTERAQELAELLERAKAQPGVRDVMAIYDSVNANQCSREEYARPQESDIWVTSACSSNASKTGHQA